MASSGGAPCCGVACVSVGSSRARIGAGVELSILQLGATGAARSAYPDYSRTLGPMAAIMGVLAAAATVSAQVRAEIGLNCSNPNHHVYPPGEAVLATFRA